MRKNKRRDTKRQATAFANRVLAGLLLISVAFGILAPATPTNAGAKKATAKAHSYVVMDANSGKTLSSYKANKKIYPASTVKVMTAVVALDHMKTSKKIRFTKKMRRFVSTSDIAHFGLKVGATYTVYNYLHMLLLSSDADAATALAIGCSGSVKEFSKEMNKKAKALGMNHTSFDNPIGLDKGNGFKKTYTTAADFAILARYAMRYPTIRKVAGTKTYRVPKAKGRAAFTIHNTNGFYHYISYNKKNYQVIGLKTGSTTAAGHVLLTVAKDKNGHEVICAFFGKSTGAQMYQDIKSLLDDTFARQRKGKIKLSKGFWDTRFRDSEKVIRTYANKGILKGESGRFYPKEDVEPADADTFIEEIAGETSAFAQLDSSEVSVLDVRQWFEGIYGEGAFANASLLPEELLNEEEHILSKEEMVLFAEQLRLWKKQI